MNYKGYHKELKRKLLLLKKSEIMTGHIRLGKVFIP